MIHPSDSDVDQVMAETGMGRIQAINHVRAREILRLRLNSPKRGAAGQADAGHLPLFIGANEPRLL